MHFLVSSHILLIIYFFFFYLNLLTKRNSLSNSFSTYLLIHDLAKVKTSGRKKILIKNNSVIILLRLFYLSNGDFFFVRLEPSQWLIRYYLICTRLYWQVMICPRLMSGRPDSGVGTGISTSRTTWQHRLKRENARRTWWEVTHREVFFVFCFFFFY